MRKPKTTGSQQVKEASPARQPLSGRRCGVRFDERC